MTSRHSDFLGWLQESHQSKPSAWSSESVVLLRVAKLLDTIWSQPLEQFSSNKNRLRIICDDKGDIFNSLLKDLQKKKPSELRSTVIRACVSHIINHPEILENESIKINYPLVHSQESDFIRISMMDFIYILEWALRTRIKSKNPYKKTGWDNLQQLAKSMYNI